MVMIGKKFGQLTVKFLLDERKHGQKVYTCICDCGNTSTVLGANLRKGNSTSCGCLRKTTCSIRMTGLNLRHGETNTKLWRTWKGVVERTTNPYSSHYARYGGKGIGIYPDWLVYENFALYMGEPPTQKHSIDRIKNNKGYEPENVRWATAKEQAENRKTNVYVFLNGKKMILSQAAQILNISKSSASRWLAQGKLKITNA
jgi:hypothetical protein